VTRRRRLVPLVLATIATQSSIVVLAPILAEIAGDLGASISATGQARTILAGTAVAVSLAIGPLIDRVGIRPLLVWGSSLALLGAAVTAAAPGLAVFYAAHAITGLGVACMLSAGFAGVAGYFGDRELGWAMGYVVGAQSLAWIVGNPITGVLTDAVSWRLAYAVPAAMALAALIGALGAPRDDAIASAEQQTSGGPLAVLTEPSARRWAVAELVAYSAWTAQLTYAGAFYVETYGISEATVGFVLSVGSFAFLASSTGFESLARRFGRKRLTVTGGLGMGSILALALNVTPSLAFTVSVFFVMALFAGIRSTGSSALGLDQLPDRPGSMMAARTTSSQLGYMVGAVLGGVVLALSGFGALGWILLAGMALSALLISRVGERSVVDSATP
jgi:predicted MFS family arabinose efflux permease